jgi:hypothetical protein
MTNVYSKVAVLEDDFKHIVPIPYNQGDVG